MSKIDAQLRLGLADSFLVSDRIGKRGNSHAELFVLEQDAHGKTVVPVFVTTTDVAKTSAAVLALGGSVSSSAGGILIARVPPGRIQDLAGSKEVARIESSQRMNMLLDVSRAEVRADQVQAGTGLPASYTGKGVVVGIVDSGIDWSHPDFKDASGRSRILSIWDQTTTGKPPAGFSYGYECTNSDINNSACPERDTNSHGTHVSGIAAGNGRARSGAPLRGMAPEADLIVVKTNFKNTGINEGVDYIFKRALSLGKPAVVNLSLGGHIGPHDGTSSQETFLSALVGPGKLIVAANGNEQDNRIHLGYDAQGSDYQTGWSSIFKFTEGSRRAVIDLWYNSGTVSVGLQADDASFKGLDGVSAISTGSLDRHPLKNGTTILGYVSMAAETTSSGSRHVIMLIDDNGDSTVNLEATAWELFTFGSGHVDAWSDGAEFFDLENRANGYIAGDFKLTVGMPATAQNVIGVGSYGTKSTWTDLDGVNRQAQSTKVGDISYFSSLGPTRDGRQRPLISAPGQWIVSSLSSAADPNEDSGNTNSLYLSGGSYRVEQGTSQACPHVAGIIALMLQAKPSLGLSETTGILQSKARKDSFTGAAASNTWGAGKIDALASVQAVAGSGTTPPPPNGAALKLLNGRFEITLTAKDTGRSNKSGDGVPITEPGNNLFGYFSIPDLTGNPGNPEVFLKVLDVGGGKYWVFYSGLTDLEYTLTVKDTATGKSKAYRKAIGSFCGDADTNFSAFPGGTIAVLSVVEKPLMQSLPKGMTLESMGASLNDQLGVKAKARPTGLNVISEAFPIHPTATCSSALNLFASRFALTMAAQDPRSLKLGCGLALPKTDLFGYYSIPDLTFNPSNPEVFTKMIDARQIDNGNFWIFVGRLTDFSVVLRVDDREAQKSFVTDPAMPGGNLCGAVYTFKP